MDVYLSCIIIQAVIVETEYMHEYNNYCSIHTCNYFYSVFCFITNIIDTTCPGQVHSHDFTFVTREEFERDIHLDQFLEYSEIKGYWYGTALSSIKKVMEEGCVPVMNLHSGVSKLINCIIDSRFHKSNFFYKHVSTPYNLAQ